MKLLVQPGEGIAPLVKGIEEARTSIEILVFRLDRVEIENALVKAVERGVAVRALIAHTNRGGEARLRALELRLLAAGVTVARTDDDLVRYHGKLMIVDGKELYLMGFNLTNIDMERSRSFAVITDDKEVVDEAIKLFDADSKRVPYSAGPDAFVVSPVNARALLAAFIKAATTELLIYDPAVTDPAMVRILAERAKAGVVIKLIGRLSRKVTGIESRRLPMRLHSRVIIRDREEVFLGSQSLRTLELDARREVGLIFQAPKISARLIEVFENDWAECEKSATAAKEIAPEEAVDEGQQLGKVAKKVAKTVTKELPPVAPILEVIVREVAGPETEMDINSKELESTVKDAVKGAIQEVVTAAVVAASKEAE
jgi:phosphatidylserine/phosphatidylglycerophosphate/cardiolipin synthase-like enzyme